MVAGVIVGWIVFSSRCGRISYDWILWWLLCPSVVVWWLEAIVDCDCRIWVCLLDVWMPESWRLSVWSCERYVWCGMKKEEHLGMEEGFLNSLCSNCSIPWELSDSSELKDIITFPSNCWCGWSDGAVPEAVDLVPAQIKTSARRSQAWSYQSSNHQIDTTIEDENRQIHHKAVISFLVHIMHFRPIVDRKEVKLNSKRSDRISLMELQRHLLKTVVLH